MGLRPPPEGRGRSLDYRPRTLVSKPRVAAATSRLRYPDLSATRPQPTQAHASEDRDVNAWKAGGTLPRKRRTTRMWLGHCRPFTCMATSW